METSVQGLTQPDNKILQVTSEKTTLNDLEAEMPLQQTEFIPAETIAEGSYGEVTRCVAIKPDGDTIEYTPMVEKTLKPIAEADAQEFEAIREDLNNEASIMHRLHSQELQITAVPTVVQFNENESLVMTLIQGKTLDKFFSVISQDQTIDITYQLLRVLQQIHENAGIIVRDIKPANIFVLKLFKKELVLRAIGDFGIAHATRSTPVANNERVLGSPPYIPPEVYGYTNSLIEEFQLNSASHPEMEKTTQEESTDEKEKSKPVIGQKTDIFAVGILLEQFLAGRYIQAADVGEGALNYRLLREKIVELLETVPPHLVPIIQKATDFRETQRYQYASLMIEDLDTLQVERSFLSCVTTDRLNHESFSEDLRQAVEESDQLNEEKLLDISHTFSLLLLNSQNRDLVDLPLAYLEEYLTEETLTSDVAEVMFQTLRYLDTPALGWPEDQQKEQREDIRNRLLHIIHTNLRDNYLEGVYASYLYDTAGIPIPAKLKDIVEEIKEEHSDEQFIFDPETGERVPLEIFMQRMLSGGLQVEENQSTNTVVEVQPIDTSTLESQKSSKTSKILSFLSRDKKENPSSSDPEVGKKKEKRIATFVHRAIRIGAAAVIPGLMAVGLVSDARLIQNAPRILPPINISSAEVAPSTFPTPLPGQTGALHPLWELHQLGDTESSDWDALTNVVDYDAGVMHKNLTPEEKEQIVNFLKNYQIKKGIQIDSLVRNGEVTTEGIPIILAAIDCLSIQTPIVDVPAKDFNRACLEFDKLANPASDEDLQDQKYIQFAKDIDGYVTKYQQYYSDAWDTAVYLNAYQTM